MTAASCSKVSSEIYVMHICILSIFILFWGEKDIKFNDKEYVLHTGEFWEWERKKSERKDNCKTPRTQRTLGKGGRDE